MKKILSLALALIMVTSVVVMPSTAYAAVKAPPKTTITKIVAQPVAFKISWKTVKKASGYQVQYSTSKKFTKKATKSVKIKKASSKSKTVKKLKAKKKYYVRVRTYKTYKSKGKTKYKYSKYSKTKSVTTKKAVTSMPVPANVKVKAKKNSVSVSFSKVSGASGYDIRIATDKNMKKLVVRDTVFGTSNTYSKLKYKTTYYIRVRSFNQKLKYSSWSSVKSVTTPMSDKEAAIRREYPELLAKAVTDSGARVGLSDLENIYCITSYIGKNMHYDGNTDYEGDNFLDTRAYDVLKQNTYDCIGCSHLFIAMCESVKVDSYLVDGGSHVWNIVKINGYWYGIDAEKGWFDPTDLESCISIYGSCSANDRYGDFATLHPIYDSITLWNSCQPHGTIESRDALQRTWPGFENWQPA